MNAKISDINPLQPGEERVLLQYEAILLEYYRAPFEAGRAVKLTRVMIHACQRKPIPVGAPTKFRRTKLQKHLNTCNNSNRNNTHDTTR